MNCSINTLIAQSCITFNNSIVLNLLSRMTECENSIVLITFHQFLKIFITCIMINLWKGVNKRYYQHNKTIILLCIVTIVLSFILRGNTFPWKPGVLIRHFSQLGMVISAKSFNVIRYLCYHEQGIRQELKATPTSWPRAAMDICDPPWENQA